MKSTIQKIDIKKINIKSLLKKQQATQMTS